MKFKIAAPQLNGYKIIYVYLPDNYRNSKNHYPVIYMHDAQNLFDDETAFASEWKVDEYISTQTKNKSIVIGIEHGNEKRVEELTPFEHEEYGGGKGDYYLDFIKNTLKPHIDLTYRTKPEAEHTTIFGSSLGGLISFYAAIKYPNTFGKSGVFSPSFWINPQIYETVSDANIPNTSKFYFLAGDKESETMIPNQNRMIDSLKSKGLKHIKNVIIKDGKHNESLWSSNFGKAYEWLYN